MARSKSYIGTGWRFNRGFLNPTIENVSCAICFDENVMHDHAMHMGISGMNFWVFLPPAQSPLSKNDFSLSARFLLSKYKA